MDNAGPFLEFQHYFGMLRRWAWLVILVTVLSGGIAYLISKRSIPVYQSITTVLISEAPGALSNDYTAIMTSERLAKTYSELITKLPVLEGVIARLGLEVRVEELQKSIQVQPVRDTTLIEVRVEDSDPKRAADIANALVLEFSERNQALQESRYQASKENLSAQLADLERQIKDASDQLTGMGDNPADSNARTRLEASLAQDRQTYASLIQSYEEVRLAEAQSTSNVIQVEPAVPPNAPIRPRAFYNTIFAMVIGFSVVLGLVFLIETMDDTIKSPDEILSKLNLQVLGVIRRHAAEDSGPAALLEPRSMVAEAFRSLRTNLQFASVNKPLQILLITSPTPAEGKSTVATNLGVVMAQSDRRVALVDADLRRPRLHELMGVSNKRGLSDLFVMPVDSIEDVMEKTASEGLFVLPSGDLPPNPSELLGSEKMAEILEQVRQVMDMVIIDSPPVTVVTDSAVLAPRVDGVLLVLKPGETRMAAAVQAVDQLNRLGANLLGVVLNDVDTKRLRSRYGRYEYYDRANHYYEADEKTLHKWWKRIKSG